MVSGKVISKEKQEVVDFATVYLKGTTYGCTTNEEGIYHLHAPAGKYTLVVSAIGYKTIEKPVTLVHGERIKMNVMIDPSVTELGEVVVVSNGVSRVKRSAFNAIAVDTKEFQIAIPVFVKTKWNPVLSDPACSVYLFFQIFVV